MYFHAVLQYADLAVLTGHCRYMRQQIESRGLSDIELGPDEKTLRMKSEPEMLSSQQREIEGLRDDLTKKQAELDVFRLQVTSQLLGGSVVQWLERRTCDLPLPAGALPGSLGQLSLPSLRGRQIELLTGWG